MADTGLLVFSSQYSLQQRLVGGGTSGAVLASRLSESSDSELLVEAGRSDLENDNVPIPAFPGSIQLTQDDWNYFSVPQKRTGVAMNNRVVIRKRRAVGVEVIKNERRLRIFANKEVILSAGIFNSPRILMLSGIGPASHLRKFGIPVVSNLPVGNNLHDQLAILLHYTINDNIT
ncbi:unnamed protein product [Mytilus coruscus]|uniref:Glucose-methanol-choline oxidoreductase N-terminal domain-containing protein n=1 Tax=Mytilus coruscus TaxID=42192 RepID=A0A6J8CEB7_MYTCO|nr:unnamed protein product [Mytilus coruscus]